MAQQTVLCIEPDAAAVDEIRHAFGTYGLHIESIPNGEQAVEWARANGPALIILSVEPRKVGYAICNKLKRSPSLREIPLVLVSTEETMATFEQHKKLKSRAEEYMLKPLDMGELVGKTSRLLGLGDTQADARAIPEEDSGEIEIGDDEIAEVSLDDDDALVEEDAAFSGSGPTTANSGAVVPNGHGGDGVVEAGESIEMLGDLSKPVAAVDLSGPSPFHDAPLPDPVSEMSFDAEQFDSETQAAFAALEAGAAEGGHTPGPHAGAGLGGGYVAPTPPPFGQDVVMEALPAERMPEGGEGSGDMVDLKALWNEGDMPAKMPWEEGAAPTPPPPPFEAAAPETTDHSGPPSSPDVEIILDPVSAQMTPLPYGPSVEDQLLAGLDSGVPPLPEEVLYDERSNADIAAKDQRIAELQARLETIEAEKRAADGKAAELQARIGSLEGERQTVRKEQDELRDRMAQAANQGALSKERDLLSLREIINKKEKDILDLRDALDAKERQILDHKDKIREHERSRRDLEERTLGFERSQVAANEKVAELMQDRDKSVEREKGLKARLDDAHEELRKGQDELEAIRKRVTQEIERGRVEVERTRIELESKLAEAEDNHRTTLSKATEEWAAADAAEKDAHESEVVRNEAAHRAEIEGLQKRASDDAAAAAERLQNEVQRLRRETEKALASLKEEQTLQLASERQAYETQTEAKHRAYRDEVLGLRRRHEEELAAAEDRRQRDILEHEQRRESELEQAENRRRAELQGRDEEHHVRVTELERRHLVEKTEMADRHRTEHDQAVGRAVRAEGELVARGQEIEQAYRRLAGFEADLDAARAELSDRDVKLGQMRDRLSELEAKVADYEDQIVRAFQRLRADERTTEKVRRALAVGLALLDERAASPVPPAPLKSVAASSEESEKS